MAGYLVSDNRKVTTHRFMEMKQKGEKISMLTSYDYTMAGIVDKAGIDAILVGDSASNVMALISRHCFLLGLGLIITIAVSRMSYKWFIPLSPIFVLFSVLAMIYVLFNGQVINGAARSFSMMGIQVQPPEFIKMSSVLVIAFVMSRCQVPKGVSTRGVVICGAVVLFFSGLLFSQGLTNTMLMMGISLTMMLVAGIQIKKFLLLILVYAIAGGAGVMIKIAHGNTED
ncbi:MAG: FtsW/RodA/SpoVE family cell cycle protein, partial [Prevotella sp.]|nr:FtsW/RodA/SpoVE family cell cycle protein [Prevotella sp.]